MFRQVAYIVVCIVLCLCSLPVLAAGIQAAERTVQEPVTLHSERQVLSFTKQSGSLHVSGLSRSLRSLRPATLNDVPFNFGRYDNLAWKFGGVLFVIGVGIFVLSLTWLFKIVTIYTPLSVYAMLLGLAFMLVSLPFILIGKLIGNRDRRSPSDEKTNYEDY